MARLSIRASKIILRIRGAEQSLEVDSECVPRDKYGYRLHLHGLWILVLTLTAIAFYAMTLAPVTWVLITEIFPNRYRGTAMSITVAALWIASFVLTYTFPILNRAVGSAGAFLFYGAICFAGAAFIFTSVPETNGKSLEDMEA